MLRFTGIDGSVLVSGDIDVVSSVAAVRWTPLDRDARDSGSGLSDSGLCGTRREDQSKYAAVNKSHSETWFCFSVTRNSLRPFEKFFLSLIMLFMTTVN